MSGGACERRAPAAMDVTCRCGTALVRAGVTVADPVLGDTCDRCTATASGELPHMLRPDAVERERATAWATHHRCDHCGREIATYAEQTVLITYELYPLAGGLTE